jgi:hypothetical protein
MPGKTHPANIAPMARSFGQNRDKSNSCIVYFDGLPIAATVLATLAAGRIAGRSSGGTMSVAISGIPNPPPAAHAHAKAADQPSPAAQDTAPQISSQSTTTNPDGSSTTTVTYSNGTTSTTSQAAPAAPQPAAKANRPAQAGAATTGTLLDSANIGQTNTLLAAQETARAPT